MSEQKIDEFAPWIGRVLLNFAEFESVLNDLDDAVEDALVLTQKDWVRREAEWKTHRKINKILTGFKCLGAEELRKRLQNERSKIIHTADLRNNVVHGQWFWDFDEDTIHTRKMSLDTKRFEYDEWTVDQLCELVEDVKDIKAVVWHIEQEMRQRWNNGEDTPGAFFMVDDDDGQHVATPKPVL